MTDQQQLMGSLCTLSIGIAFWLWSFSLVAATLPRVIVLFFRPIEAVQLPDTTLWEHLNKPIPIHLNAVKNEFLAHSISGIEAQYHGLITQSDQNGQITFPRFDTEDSLTILVTPRIIPVMPNGRRVDHFILGATPHAARYQCVRIPQVNSARAKWRITKQSNITSFDPIPINALVIFAEPEYLYFIEGEYICDMSHHLILPDVLVDPRISLPLNALRTLTTHRFFMPIHPWMASATERYVRNVV